MRCIDSFLPCESKTDFKLDPLRNIHCRGNLFRPSRDGGRIDKTRRSQQFVDLISHPTSSSLTHFAHRPSSHITIHNPTCQVLQSRSSEPVPVLMSKEGPR
ncbi:hypothetical protein MRB53_037285 [Persea americana]|nr:hypothetical protein MRB53_037285 [Persea americana]